MAIRVKCPNQECGHVRSVNEKYAGKKGMCPKCQNPITVPEVSNAVTASVSLIDKPSLSDEAANTPPPQKKRTQIDDPIGQAQIRTTKADIWVPIVLISLTTLFAIAFGIYALMFLM